MTSRSKGDYYEYVNDQDYGDYGYDYGDYYGYDDDAAEDYEYNDDDYYY